MVLIDTNVLIDVVTKDPSWFEWSSSQVVKLIDKREAAINPVIFTELAPNYEDEKQLDQGLLKPTLFKRLQLPYSSAFPTSRAFIKYKNAGGKKTSPLPDFFIGGHAEAEGHVILTRDAGRYRSYFPAVRLITP